MIFRTEITLNPSHHKITLSTPVLTIGSCFADCFGSRLTENKFSVLSNPFGVVFNPASLFQLLNNAIDKQLPLEDSFIINNGVWYNYGFHSDLSGIDKTILQSKISDRILQVHEFIKKTNYLVLTFGTAFIYELVENGRIVANCHKLPPTFFKKRILSVDEIVKIFKDVYAKLSKINPEVKLILTVSPVRHLKDSLELNTLSKAILRLAIEEIKEHHTNIDYFPSYELLLDDLRDYRFYKPDMIHPTEMAESYIWDKFSDKYLDADTAEFIKEWQKIKKALNHKPFHPDSESHKLFLKKTLEQLKSLSYKVDVTNEINELKHQIS